MADRRKLHDIGWLELGWGMLIGGLILVAASAVVAAPTVSLVLSIGIVAGGAAAVLYALNQRRTGSSSSDLR